MCIYTHIHMYIYICIGIYLHTYSPNHIDYYFDNVSLGQRQLPGGHARKFHRHSALHGLLTDVPD